MKTLKKLLVLFISAFPCAIIVLIGAAGIPAIMFDFLRINLRLEPSLPWVAFVGGVVLWSRLLSWSFSLIKWKEPASATPYLLITTIGVLCVFLAQFYLLSLGLRQELALPWAIFLFGLLLWGSALSWSYSLIKWRSSAS